VVVQFKGSGHEGIPFGKLESENCGGGDVLGGWVGERDGVDARRIGNAVSSLRQSTRSDGGFISSKLHWPGVRRAETIPSDGHCEGSLVALLKIWEEERKRSSRRRGASKPRTWGMNASRVVCAKHVSHWILPRGGA
jgi:hypothetical protein